MGFGDGGGVFKDAVADILGIFYGYFWRWLKAGDFVLLFGKAVGFLLVF